MCSGTKIDCWNSDDAATTTTSRAGPFGLCGPDLSRLRRNRVPSASSGPVIEAATSFRSGQIIDTANEQSISIEELLRRLLQQEVVYLGEEHHNRFHIETALSLLNGLSRAGRRPVVAMEMFGWESQPLLDRYVQGNDLTRQDFLSQIGWTQNWGGPFETYEPLVIFPKTEHLRLVALNPPKPLVRLVAKKGLAQARREEDWTRWNMQEETIVDDPSYRQKIFEQLRACHGGGSDDMYQTMYEASMVRDEGMAKTIVSLVEALRALRRSCGRTCRQLHGGRTRSIQPAGSSTSRPAPIRHDPTDQHLHDLVRRGTSGGAAGDAHEQDRRLYLAHAGQRGGDASTLPLTSTSRAV